MSVLRGLNGSGRTTPRRRLAVAIGLAVAIALIPALASAHVERASYWPAAAADMADGVPTGGQVPAAKPLLTALDPAPAGQETRVVCQETPTSVPSGGGGEIPQSTPAPTGTGSNKTKKKKKKKRKKKKKKLSTHPRFTLTAAQREALEGNPSIQRLDQSIASARTNGYIVRPSEGPVFETTDGQPLSGAAWQAYLDDLRNFNLELLAQCQYHSIQAAVNDSGNNDRVVVMPGVYTEKESLAVPAHPAPADNPCDGMQEQNDRGDTGALSYRYQYHCPNQQNLIAIMGRAPKLNPDGSEFVPPPPDPTDPRRNGIPDDGPCVRCNLQLEGSGISPDDVVVDSGGVKSGNGPPMDSKKDIGIRADRADGFVLRNLTARHSAEHDIYIAESDGARLERFKTYFNGDYGVLTFVAQHHLIQDCDAAGSGDAAIYPGSSAEAGEQAADPDFDADDPNLNHSESGQFSTEIRRCDMHHSSTGYSGTAGNSVWVHHNDFYDNAMGFVTDVFTATGHPGYPQDSDLIEDNEFYSNNFNPYLDPCDTAGGEKPGPNGPNQGCSDVDPRIPAPVGTAMFLPGVNNNTIRNNHMWDNWRRGTMLFAVPDSLVCGPPPAGNGGQHGCDQNEVNTSFRNEQHDNVMGRSPDHAPDPTWPSGQNVEDPNDVDFWWDQFTGNAKNCWYDNEGQESDGSGLDSVPPGALLPGESIPCENSVGTGSAFGQEAELLNCLGDYTFDTGTCDWFVTPSEPQPTP